MSDFIPIYAVDFDGTLCESTWPGIGEPNMKLINHLIKRRSEGAKLILWTCRVGERLQEAVDWCKEHGLEFDAVNDNIPEMIECNDGIDTVIGALEKQTAKKMTHEATLRISCTCPSCKNVLDQFERFGDSKIRVTYQYCHFCGQKLDWSDISGQSTKGR